MSAAPHHDPQAASTSADTSPGWAWRDVVALHRQRPVPPRGERRAAIVLGGGTDPRLVRAAQRLTGEPVPAAFCRSRASAPTLLEQALRRVQPHVRDAAVQVVMDQRQRRWVEPLQAQLPGRVRCMPADNGAAVAVVAGLVSAVVRDPETTVVVMPVVQSVANEHLWATALDRAFRISQLSRDLVLLGAEPNGPIGEHDWLVPFAPRWLAGTEVIPSARLLKAPSPMVVSRLSQVGALIHTGVVVGQGRAFLELFEELTPRLLRLFLYGAAMPDDEAQAFVDQAQKGLGELDLSHDLLALARVLRVVTVPASTGWIDLRSPARMATWLARERNQRLLSYPLATTYRRRHVPGDVAS